MDLHIKWLDGKSKGYVSVIPQELYSQEGSWVPIQHRVLGPDGRDYRAVCNVSVSGTSATFDYTPYAQERGGHYLGVLTLRFKDETRTGKPTEVLWRDKGSEQDESLTPAPNITIAALVPEQPPVGNATPQVTISTTSNFVRDPAVKAWVIAEAKGICECCEKPAPFVTADGPYLEVHHVRHLADLGPDTVDNAIAICPNCHRRLHYSLDAAELIESLYARIKRLIRV